MFFSKYSIESTKGSSYYATIGGEAMRSEQIPFYIEVKHYSWTFEDLCL